MNVESILFNVLDGFRNSFMPQYTDKGSAIIPAHVIKVPEGIVLASSKAIINNGELVTKSTIAAIVTIKELKNQIFLALIFVIIASGFVNG